MTPYQGGCLCGAVRFSTTARLRDVIFCHCSQCRRQTGLFYAATSVPKADLVITGEQNLSWYSASTTARRGFCKTCGSALFWEPATTDYVSILAGAFDDPSVLTAGYHMCTQDRAGFYSITDGLPQFPQDTAETAIAP